MKGSGVRVSPSALGILVVVAAGGTKWGTTPTRELSGHSPGCGVPGRVGAVETGSKRCPKELGRRRFGWCEHWWRAARAAQHEEEASPARRAAAHRVRGQIPVGGMPLRNRSLTSQAMGWPGRTSGNGRAAGGRGRKLLEVPNRLTIQVGAPAARPGPPMTPKTMPRHHRQRSG